MHRPNWLFVLGVGSCFLVPILVAMLPVSGRLLSVILGFVAFTGLGYRFVAHYRDTQTAGRVAVALIMASLLIGAIIQIDLFGQAEFTAAGYALIGQRWGCVLFAICYDRILDLGTRSPWVRPREAANGGRLPDQREAP